MTTVSTTPKGLVLPTSKPIPGGNPGAAAIQSSQDQAAQQVKMQKHLTGGKRQRGGIGKVVVPQMSLQYNQVSGKGQGVNDTIAQNAGHSMQASSNAQYDHLATKDVKGGSRRKRKLSKKNKKTSKTYCGFIEKRRSTEFN